MQTARVGPSNQFIAGTRGR